MFEIELDSPDVMSIKTKDREIKINLAESEIDAGLSAGKVQGAGEFEIGDAQIVALSLENGSVLYRIKIGGVKIGLVDKRAKPEDLDELGPIDIFGTDEIKFVSMVEPKVVIPMGNMDFADLKGEIRMDKKLKVKNVSALPNGLEIWRLG